MLIGVVSDSHGNRIKMHECLPYLKKVEYLLHAGDFYEDAELIAGVLNCQVTAVVGNCDYMVKGPTEEMIVLDGNKIYLTHGHLYKVKRNLTGLFKRAKSLKAQIVVFGHTHFPEVFHKSGILFVNPGSLDSPRHGYEPSVAIIDTSRRRPEAELVFIK